MLAWKILPGSVWKTPHTMGRAATGNNRQRHNSALTKRGDRQAWHMSAKQTVAYVGAGSMFLSLLLLLQSRLLPLLTLAHYYLLIAIFS